MTAQTIGAAVAVRQPSDLVEQYRADLSLVMPSHMRPDTWVRLAVGVLRGNKDLIQAARNDEGALMRALMTAARLGLEPGTEQFYLLPRKEKGIYKVQGIVGYQGIVELIYRAGAASSVVVEVVREHDKFAWVPGAMERPIHEADWFSDRGDLKGVYAYAIMQGGATSKVVVLNRQHIQMAMDKADGVNTQYSPWKTNPESMWLKTAARRLAKWVPTSAEYMTERIKAAQALSAAATPALPPLAAVPESGLGEEVDGEVVHDHEGDFDPACLNCRAESADLDRQAAV